MTIEERLARIEAVLAQPLTDLDSRLEAERKQRIREQERALHGQNFTPEQRERMREAELARRQRDPEYRARQEAKEREQSNV